LFGAFLIKYNINMVFLFLLFGAFLIKHINMVFLFLENRVCCWPHFFSNETYLFLI